MTEPRWATRSSTRTSRVTATRPSASTCEGAATQTGFLLGEYLKQEQDDALEVLAWLAEQAWCTGDVGMIGYSWGGFNGLQIAARQPAQLKAVITGASTDDRYLDDCHYMGGCLLASDMLKWSSSMLGYAIQPPDPRVVGEGWRELWLERLEHAPELARDWVFHQRRDAFWRHGSIAEDYSAVRCPVMAVGGWADAYVNAVPRMLENLDVPRLGLIGPWGHMLPHTGVPGPAIGFLQEALRWWDRWLKGIETGIMHEPMLRAWIQEPVAPAGFYDDRPGRWVAVAEWPALASPAPKRLVTGARRRARGLGRDATAMRRSRCPATRSAARPPASGAQTDSPMRSRSTSGPTTSARSPSPPSRCTGRSMCSATPTSHCGSAPTGRVRSSRRGWRMSRRRGSHCS